MMKTKNNVLPVIFILTGVGIVTYYGFKDKIIDKVEDNISFKINSFKVKGGGFLKLDIPIEYTITNQNIIGAKGITFNGGVLYQGLILALIPKVTPIEIPPKSSVTSTITAKVDLFLLPEIIREVINNAFRLNLRLVGTVDSNFGSFTLDKTFNVLKE